MTDELQAKIIDRAIGGVAPVLAVILFHLRSRHFAKKDARGVKQALVTQADKVSENLTAKTEETSGKLEEIQKGVNGKFEAVTKKLDDAMDLLAECDPEEIDKARQRIADRNKGY